ncbi:hypothetical protein [Glycomyces tenuis]|uniref:hypothetical protein n=1 Tax=Glycomyces tenuis TaxID=58116 RepID=UPI000479930F|nr:hypothetical protein [Glycomyces tenuis]
MPQDLEPDVQRQDLGGPELPLELAGGDAEDRVGLGVRHPHHRRVRVLRARPDRGVGVQEAALEHHQRPFGAFEIAPLLHLARARPQPVARPQGVLGEVHRVAQRAGGERQQVVLVRAQRAGEQGRVGTVAEFGECEHLDAGGQARRDGERMYRIVIVSCFNQHQREFYPVCHRSMINFIEPDHRPAGA